MFLSLKPELDKGGGRGRAARTGKAQTQCQVRADTLSHRFLKARKSLQTVPIFQEKSIFILFRRNVTIIMTLPLDFKHIVTFLG